jgi:hypothetical protein
MIGKAIHTLLETNAALVALVPVANFYPYVMNENTVLPALVYTIDSVSPNYDKDNWHGDDYQFSVISFSTNYSNLQAIALQVRVALERKKGTTDAIKYEYIYLDSQTEEGFIDGFSNKLVFRVNVIGY